MRKSILCFLLVTLSLTGCRSTRQTSTLFDDIESLMASAPDSALCLLRSIDPDTLGSRACRARHALLHAQALDKNGIDLKSDSVIAPAAAYYARRGSKRDKAYTNYYLGRIRNNAGQIGEAVELMQAAEKYAAPIGETYLLGLIYNCRANLYYSQYSLDEALEMYDKADSCFRLEGKIVFAGYMAKAKATTYAIMQNFTASQREYRKALTIFDSTGNNRQVCLISSSMATQMTNDRNISTSAVKNFLNKTYKCHSNGHMPASDNLIWARIYFQENNLDSARYYGSLALKYGQKSTNQRCGTLATICQIEEAANNYKTASKYWQEAYSLLDSISRHEKENLIQRIEQRYENKELQHHNEVLRLRNRSFVSIGALILTILLSTFILILRRRQEIILRQKEESERRQAYIDALTENYEALKGRYEEFLEDANSRSEEDANLMKAIEKRLTDMKRLLGIAYSGGCNPQIFYNAFKEYATGMNNDEHAFSDLRYVINKRYNGIVDYLRKVHPKLTSSELNMLCMLLYGFSFDCIRLVFNHDNIDSIYSRRNKLREKLGLPPGNGSKIEKYLFKIAEELKGER